MQIKSKY